MATLTQTELDRLLQQTGAYCPTGHFAHSQTVHTTDYFRLEGFRGQRETIRSIAAHIATLFLDEEPEVVLSPIGGASLFTRTIAWQFWHVQDAKLKVKGMELKENNGLYYPASDYEFDICNKRVLLFLGTCAQPKRIGRLLESIQGYGGRPIGVSVLCLRAECPLYSLDSTVQQIAVFHKPATFYLPEVCPGYREDLPLIAFP